jgi:serine/threonine protein kinase/tetratricopeptide (TPR) repeat protein
MATQQDNWKAVKTLFEASLDLDPADRSSFLIEHCPDAALRAEVERLLASHQDAGSFLSTPVVADLSTEPVIETPKLSQGAVLAGRFRIVRYIAGGGMGDVYEAEDEELRERIAVKTIRPEVLRQPNAMARFRREVHLSRKVTHPNVCRIFDSFRHKANDGTEIAFIGMELLRGNTLSARLKAGRMNMMEAMPLIQQMASALSAAHAVGIVHRDFKPGNVVLVETPGQEKLRAVVTDFGLAMQSVVGDETVPLSISQGVVGTPAYMSPEQIEGSDATAASDIYALGLVIYEMVTGEKPFGGETTLSTLAKRLTSDPRRPRQLAPDLSPAWESVVLRCLMRDPADRFANAEDVATALGENSVQSVRGQKWRSTLTKKRGRIVALILGFSAAATLVGYKWRTLRSADNTVLAVAGFKNNSGDPSYDWLATDLSETLTADLGVSKGIQTASADELARVRTEFSIPMAQSLESQNLTEVRQALGANYLLLGSFSLSGQSANGQPGEKNLTLDVRLEDSHEDTIATLHRSGAQAEYNQLVSEITGDILGKLGTTRVLDEDTSQSQNIYPKGAEERKLYFEALDRLRALDAPAALDLLKKAVQQEPDNVAIHSALADTWSQLKHDSDAAREAKAAADLAQKTSLPFENVVLAQARSEEMTQNWDAAIKDYGLLFPHYPQLNYGLRLVNAQFEGNHPQAALATLDQLSSLPPPINSDPRIETARAKVYGSMSDFTNQLRSAQLALTEAQRRRARMMQANAELELCWAHRSLGHVEDALATCNQAQTIFSVFGDNVSAAVALNDVATLLYDRGRYAEARQMYDRIIQIHKAAGAQKDLAGANINIAAVLIRMGKPEDAKDYLDTALQVSAAIHDEEDEARAYILKGSVLSSIRDLVLAEAEIRKALAIAERLNDSVLQASAFSNLAEYQSETDSKSALAAYEKVLKLRRANGNPTELATSLFNMGDLQYRRGELETSEASYREAIRISVEQKDKGGFVLGSASLAQINLERHRLTEAEHQALDALEKLKDVQDADLEANVDSVLARIFVAEDRLPEAAGYVDRIEKIVSQNQDTNFEDRMSVAIYMAAAGHTDDAIKQIRTLPSDANHAGRNFVALEAELLLLEFPPDKQITTVSRQKQLASVRQQAMQAGFGLLIRRATHMHV